MVCASEEGGHRAAVCYTLVNSCKLQGINPFTYLKDVFERVGSHPMSRVRELTPLGWKTARGAAN